jgi:hypothetical protein
VGLGLGRAIAKRLRQLLRPPAELREELHTLVGVDAPMAVAWVFSLSQRAR